MADPAIGRLAPDVDGDQRLAAFGLHRFGDDDQREVAALALQPLDLLGDAGQPIGDLRHQDDVGTAGDAGGERDVARSEEHTSELQSLMRISYAVFSLKKKNKNKEKITR